MAENPQDTIHLIELPQRFRDRDVFHDSTGRVYVTLGYIQPHNQVIAYLKYVPDPQGRWKWNDTCYRRVFSNDVQSVIAASTLVPHEYLVYDNHLGTDLLEVPRAEVSCYFSPEARLHEILTDGPRDPVEERAATLTEALHDSIGIPFPQLGVAGSVSWRAHNPEWSDVNLNIYGFEDAWHLYANYETVAEAVPSIGLRRGTGWSSSIGHLHEKVPSLDVHDISRLFERRTEFICMNHYITVMPISLPEEAFIGHGSETYTSITQFPVQIHMEIESDQQGIFLPAVYEGVSNPIEFMDGLRVSRIMIYDGAFRGMLRAGDHVQVSGMVQRVEPVRGGTEEPFYQVMIGTRAGVGQEYVRLLD
jgi:predicted nucleotidyltransferase